MTAIMWAVLAFAAGITTTVIGDMASQEARDRLDHLPHAILRLAARRLSPGQRNTVYQDEWVPELDWILTGKETRPITRLITGARFATSLLVNAGRIGRGLRANDTAAATLALNTKASMLIIKDSIIRKAPNAPSIQRVISSLEALRTIEQVIDTDLQQRGLPPFTVDQIRAAAEQKRRDLEEQFP